MVIKEDHISLAVVHEARARGVLLDVGHGTASFSFKVMRFARDNGIETDFISTDLHRNSIKGTAYDQPTTFSKLLNLGMPLEKVIAAGSTRPSAFLDPTNGDDWLTVGQKADLTVFRVDQTIS